MARLCANTSPECPGSGRVAYLQIERDVNRPRWPRPSGTILTVAAATKTRENKLGVPHITSAAKGVGCMLHGE